MFIVTNRKISKNSKTTRAFGNKPSPKGSNEIRMAHVEKKGKAWQVNILPDTYAGLPAAEKRKALFPKGYQPEFSSAYVAARLMYQARNENKNILFFVHGYNNNVKALLERMEKLAKNYNVIPVGFSWPANGGGARGAIDYLSDKRDARASAGALERTVEKAAQYLTQFNLPDQHRLFDAAGTAETHDLERRLNWLVRKIRENCPFKITLMCHSMGNYLYKQALKSSVTKANPLLFDNIILAAADVNLKDHKKWVDKLKFRNRLYIAINENDGPLGFSRMKLGDLQLERLGHATRQLKSENACYIDFTHANHVDDSHSYFEGSPLKNPDVKNFWQKAVNGETVETSLKYLSESNLYRV